MPYHTIPCSTLSRQGQLSEVHSGLSHAGFVQGLGDEDDDHVVKKLQEIAQYALTSNAMKYVGC